jgi:hypothetical protein
MHRFAGTEKPPGDIKASLAHLPAWQELNHGRNSFDGVILRWAEALEPSWLDGELR